MLKHYFTSAIRSLSKNRTISILNLAGLSLGLTSFLLVALYVIDEITYDRYNVRHADIFRVNSELKYNGATTAFAVAAPPIAEALVSNFPEVEKTARLMPLRNVRFQIDGNIVREDRVFFADASVFEIFTLPALHGDPVAALTTPGSAVITESAAERYFGTSDVVGKVIAQPDDTAVLIIGAVMKDMPSQSHFHADFFLPLVSNPAARSMNFNQFSFHTYLLLNKKADPQDLEAKFPAFLRKHLSSNMDMDKFEAGGNHIGISLTALTDIHLHSNKQRELEANGDIRYVYIFVAVALLILFMACINFMNLATARSANRAREVGIRKVLGTGRNTLVAQFLLESIFITIVSVLTACLFAWLFLPVFNELAGKNILINMWNVAWLLPAIAALALAVGLIAGSYPAFFLSRFRPIEVLKGQVSAGFKGSRFRTMLVVFQFSTSTFLVIGTIAVYHQLSYMLKTDVGFDREHVVIVKYASVLEDPSVLKEQVEVLRDVKSASLSGYLPTGGSRWGIGISLPEQEGFLGEQWLVDPDYIPTMGMKLVQGRNFSKQLPTDSSSILINETAAKMLGFSGTPLNQLINVGSGPGVKQYNVIGIVKDFNFNSLRENITPLVMILGSDWSASLNVRVEEGKLASVLHQLRKKWNELMPNQEFDYSFMDEDFEATYRAELRIQNLFFSFSFLAIVIACLGLFGLSVYAAEQRMKEISIRKVLGATISDIITTLSFDFIKPVLIAIVITMPLAWWAVQEWLQTFAYRETIPAWSFLLAGSITVTIAALTISFQCAKAGRVSPAESLKSE